MAEVTIERGEVLEMFRQAGVNLEPRLHETLDQWGGRAIERGAKKNIQARLKRRTGRLINSIGYAFTGPLSLEAGVLQAVGGAELAYAGMREYGGTIYGKPWLAIPLPTAEKYGITTKAGAGGVRASFVRDNPEQFGFVSTFRLGHIIWGQLPGKATKTRWNMVPLYVLKRSVPQTGVHYLRDAVDAALPTLDQKIQDTVAKVFAS